MHAVTWTGLDYICTWRSLSTTRSLCWSHWKPASSLHRPPTTGPSHFTQPFVSDAVLWGWPHRDLWGHRGQTARDLRVLDLLFTSSWQPQWRNRVRLRQQQFTDDVDGWWWRHHVFLYSCVESDVILHIEWLHHLNCLLWVAWCLLFSFFLLSFILSDSNQIIIDLLLLLSATVAVVVDEDAEEEDVNMLIY